MKQALITGILGQDGSYLTKLLLNKKYEVLGLIAGEISEANFSNFEKLGINPNSVTLINLEEVESKIQEKCEVYNFASQSSVADSWKLPKETFESNIVFYIELIEKLRNKKVKLLQASSAEMFGNVDKLNEETIMDPENPYSLSKYTAHKYGQILRKGNNLFISNAILFPHESKLRDTRFVTRKIVDAAKAIKEGKQEILELGNIYVERDWGHASDYVEAMWQILQLDKPEDFIICTEKIYSIKDWVNETFKQLGIELIWDGKDLEETAKRKDTGEIIVKISPDFFRPNQMKTMHGSYAKLREKTGWQPKLGFKDIIFEMISTDL